MIKGLRKYPQLLSTYFTYSAYNFYNFFFDKNIIFIIITIKNGITFLVAYSSWVLNFFLAKVLFFFERELKYLTQTYYAIKN